MIKKNIKSFVKNLTQPNSSKSLAMTFTKQYDYCILTIISPNDMSIQFLIHKNSNLDRISKVNFAFEYLADYLKKAKDLASVETLDDLISLKEFH